MTKSAQERGSPAAVFAWPDGASSHLRLSVVAPMLNEEAGAAELVREIAAALSAIPHEIIIVDDGSSDATRAALLGERAMTPQLRVVAHARTAGQSRAIRTGVIAARAPIIATLDGDGQNDPADIPALLAVLTRDDAPATLALVGGERRKRQDQLARRWASKIANSVRSSLLRDGAIDTGCGLKVFYREAFLRLPAFDHMHRYLPALMRREGFQVAFRPVNHRARVHGRSKYTNLGRLAAAFHDLLGVMWLNDRARSPKEISEL
jgi:glycosyltransferase involved in cell wall biosynthesis